MVSPKSTAPVPALPCHTHQAHNDGPGQQPGPWRLRDGLPLGAHETAVPSARLHARLIVTEWGLRPLAHTVELIVSELVTNSIRASAGLAGYRCQGTWRAGAPPVWLWLWSDGTRVLVQVWDADHHQPATHQPTPDDEHGRGLLLVEHLSHACGTYQINGTTGKVIWALITPTST